MGSVSKPFQTREGLSGFFSGIYVHSRIFWILGGYLFFSSFYFLGASTFFSIVRSTPTFSDSLFSPPLCIIISGDTPVRTRARRKSDRSAWVFLGVFFSFLGGYLRMCSLTFFPFFTGGPPYTTDTFGACWGGEWSLSEKERTSTPIKNAKSFFYTPTYFLLLCPSPFYSPQSP